MMRITGLYVLFQTALALLLKAEGPVTTQDQSSLQGATLDRSTLVDANTSGSKVPARTSKTETLRKAGNDLRSEEEGLRVGAAKLLGKYPGSGSALMLVGALDDPSALVRRAAIVSLAEQANNGYPLYDRSLLEKIFSKLDDQDVEIRREVSAMIPRLAGGLMRSSMEAVEINGRKVYRTVPSTLRPDLFGLAQKAMLDEDAIVRQNMLKYYQYLRIIMPASSFEKLLNDKDQGVLLAALNRVSVHARDPKVISRVEQLSKHPSKGIRLKVVDVARDCNRHNAKYRSLLRAMTQDQDPEVTSMAAVELARLGERLPSATIDKIKKYLLNARGMTAQVTTILYAVSSMGEDGVNIYKSLTSHSSSKIRTIAWQRLLSLTSGWKQPSTWLPATLDQAKEVRDTVLMNLRGLVGPLSPKQMSGLVASPYADVRIFAGQCLVSAPEESVQEFAFELLIDENEIVRSTAIRAVGGRKFTGWLKIMSRSLLDDNYAVQRAAMDVLLSDSKEGVPALRDHIAKYPSSKISSLARNELQRVKGGR
jgi:hypothetical protein